MKCNYCNNSIPVDSVFCPFCGKKQHVSEVISENVCGNMLDTLFSKFNFLDLIDVLDILYEGNFPQLVNRRLLSDGTDGKMDYTFQFHDINITTVFGENNSVSKIVYRNVSFNDLSDMFWTPEGIANSVDLRSYFSDDIEKVDGDDFDANYCNSLRFYFRFRKDGSIRCMIVEVYKDRSFWLTAFPLNGVVLGETSIRQLEKNHRLIHDGNKIQWENDGIVYESSSNNKIDMVAIDNSVEIPEQLEKYGFDWYMSYEEYKNLFYEKGLKRNEDLELPPKVMSKKGRFMLYATIELSLDDVVDCKLVFNMGNKHGEGCSTSSHNSLYQIIFTYVD